MKMHKNFIQEITPPFSRVMQLIVRYSSIISSSVKMHTRWKFVKIALLQIWILFLFCWILLYFINTPKNKEPSLPTQNEDISIRSPESLSFLDTMRSFPWTPYKHAVLTNDSLEIQQYSNLLLLKLVRFLTKPPVAAVNTNCEPPPLEMPVGQKCTALPRPHKVGVLVQFGFDVDALEIHLHELDAVVDKFFLIESIQAHSSYITHLTKPLMWDRVKFDERFAQFAHKIVHFVVDDASLSQVDPDAVWERELQQEELRWKKFLDWNNATKYFATDDIIGFGDVDEISDRNNVYFMKNCELPSDPVDIGIWFPYGGIDTVFVSDFRVKGHNYTFAEPTFWTLGKALGYPSVSGKAPTRLKGNSFKYLLGGMHLSRYPFPPYQMTKLLTKSSAMKERTLERIIESGLLYASNKSVEAEEMLRYVPPKLSKRIKDLGTFREENSAEANLIVKIPWFLKCNQDRFPSFNNGRDLRLNE